MNYYTVMLLFILSNNSCACVQAEGVILHTEFERKTLYLYMCS